MYPVDLLKVWVLYDIAEKERAGILKLVLAKLRLRGFACWGLKLTRFCPLDTNASAKSFNWRTVHWYRKCGCDHFSR